MQLRGNILVSGNADSTVKVWDINTGECLQTLEGSNKHQSAVTCLQFNARFVITSSDDGTVKLWDLKAGEFIRNLVSLPSGGSGGVVWRIRASNTRLVCAVGSRNGTEETKLLVLDFDCENETDMPSRSSLPMKDPTASSSSLDVMVASTSRVQCRYDAVDQEQQEQEVWDSDVLDIEVMDAVDFDEDDDIEESNSNGSDALQPPEGDLEDLVICE
jgi:WD40 repeat protein